jgi:CHAT domain-containing protein
VPCLEDCDSRCHPSCEGGARLGFGDVHLVVLSACRTASQGGAPEAGQPEASLARLAATLGAHAVLGTLWAVNDQSTSAFMQAFYRDLHARGGKGKARSVQAAALSLLRSPGRPEWRHPWYWAAFPLSGNIR